MAGYSGTPLATKLGIKAGTFLVAVNAPNNYDELIGPLPAGATMSSRLSSATTLVHLFATRRSDLEKALTAYRAKLSPETVVWVSWPKKASKVPTDITEDTIRDVALPMGWVDIKVCAVDDVWSGLKLVVRKALR